MNQRFQRGFTLIELMVSITLGLLIVAAATQLFVANQVSLNYQRGTGDVQANGRYAMDQIVRDVRFAGIREAASIPVEPIAFFTTDVIGTGVTTAQVSSNDDQDAGITGTGLKSDQIMLQYVAPTDMVDCEGNSITKGTYLVERYYLATDSDTGTKGLLCDSGNYPGTGAVTGLGSGAAVLASGVDSFQVLYGIDDGVNGAAVVKQYLTAAGYTALAAPRPPIVAVRIGLYVKSLERVGDTIAAAAAVNVLDKQIPAANVPVDGRLRRLFVSTVALRNTDPDGV
jgi:type IV pilus assembly protein PilW